ncbi:unnamed protein product [Paramecium sonneborni]|uniref:Uncharacterized protein n=1 Tax=Paramecium sonneborni TaxID=65129 RepID=A0A8S1JWQ9_9CILI|nr:unnamed protein product [Paramecium sonneborni]
MKNFRIYLVGESNSGKSSIINALKNKPFNFNISQTIGVDYWSFTKNQTKFEIYDTSGLKKFEQATILGMKSANLIIICFDLCSSTAYQDVEKWLNIVLTHKSVTQTIIIGNKMDKQLQKKNENIRHLIQNYSFYKTSALNSKSVKKVFEDIVQNLLITSQIVDRVEISPMLVQVQKRNWLCLC